MKRYITNKANVIKEKIKSKITDEFETDLYDLLYKNGWYVRIVIDEDDVIEYNVVMDENNNVDFELRR
jgi:NAD(P)H-flavin reductase